MRRTVRVYLGRKRHGAVDYVRPICIKQHSREFAARIMSKLGRAVVVVRTSRRGI